MLNPDGEVATKRLPSPVRTQGDGMENAAEVKPEDSLSRRTKNSLGDKLLYRPSDYKPFSFTPPVITGKIVNLVPKYMMQSKKDKIILGNLKGKEPKFIPYEPYKAAVKPMIPHVKKGGERKNSKKHVNLDLPVIAVHIPEVTRTKAMCEHESKTEESDLSDDWSTEKKLLEDELKALKEDNGQLESQLKFQAQVNAELKTLLVAAVGEDLQIRVHILTEDKLQLARALLNSAQSLSTHQEQTEWLAGQCEVWRSKFLASSLMVEELARWKAALCQKATDLQETLKRLLEERSKVRDSLIHTYRNLNALGQHFEVKTRVDLFSTNILDLSASSKGLSQALLESLDSKGISELDMIGLAMNTRAEKTAEALLMNPNPLLLSGRPDAACSAVMGAAVALGGQLLLGSSTLPVSCCSHCSGEIKLV